MNALEYDVNKAVPCSEGNGSGAGNGSGDSAGNGGGGPYGWGTDGGYFSRRD